MEEGKESKGKEKKGKERKEQAQYSTFPPRGPSTEFATSRAAALTAAFRSASRSSASSVSATANASALLAESSPLCKSLLTPTKVAHRDASRAAPAGSLLDRTSRRKEASVARRPATAYPARVAKRICSRQLSSSRRTLSKAVGPNTRAHRLAASLILATAACLWSRACRVTGVEQMNVLVRRAQSAEDKVIKRCDYGNTKPDQSS